MTPPIEKNQVMWTINTKIDSKHPSSNMLNIFESMYTIFNATVTSFIAALQLVSSRILDVTQPP